MNLKVNYSQVLNAKLCIPLVSFQFYCGIQSDVQFKTSCPFFSMTSQKHFLFLWLKFSILKQTNFAIHTIWGEGAKEGLKIELIMEPGYVLNHGETLNLSIILLTNINFCAAFVMYYIKLNEAIVWCIKV